MGDEWRDRAKCRGLDTNLWFPPSGVGHAEPDAICAACPVRVPCRDEGRALRAQGIWGGESENARKRAGFAPVVRAAAATEATRKLDLSHEERARRADSAAGARAAAAHAAQTRSVQRSDIDDHLAAAERRAENARRKARRLPPLEADAARARLDEWRAQWSRQSRERTERQRAQRTG